NYYGRPLSVSIVGGALRIEIGAATLAHATRYAQWANPYNEDKKDWIRTFEITDPAEFAKAVLHAMLAEREDGSTPLSDFLDKMSEAAMEDGPEGVEYGKCISLLGNEE